MLSLAGGGYRGLFKLDAPGEVRHPPGAGVVVVRNLGDESSGKNDFGHELRDTRDLEHEEHTAYNGRHFMDCAVRSHGRILAVRRVPVYVREPLFTQSLPAKPYYRRLVKRRR